MHVTHSPRRAHGSRPHVLSSPHPLPCNWPRLLLIQSPPQKLAPAGTRVHREATNFSHEARAHRIRDGHISGQKCLHLLRMVSQSMSPHPHFWPIGAHHLPRGARLAMAVGHAERQRRDGKRQQQSIVRPPRPAIPVRAAVLLSFQLGSLQGAGPNPGYDQDLQAGGSSMRLAADRRLGGHRRALATAESVQPLPAWAGGTFGVGLPVCIVRICRVVCPVPEVLPAGAEAGEGHVGSEF